MWLLSFRPQGNTSSYLLPCVLKIRGVYEYLSLSTGKSVSEYLKFCTFASVHFRWKVPFQCRGGLSSRNLVIAVQSLSCVQVFATPQAAARQAPLSMGFPKQEYWSGLPFSSPGDLPDPGIEPVSPALAGGFFTSEPPGKP